MVLTVMVEGTGPGHSDADEGQVDASMRDYRKTVVIGLGKDKRSSAFHNERAPTARMT